MKNSIETPYCNTGVPIYITDYQYGYLNNIDSEISYSIDWLRITTGKIKYGD